LQASNITCNSIILYSPKFVKDLFHLNIPPCGIDEGKEKKGVGKRKRKAMKWVRDDSCLTLQWKDNRPVTNLNSINTANEFVHIQRKENVTTVA